MYDYKGLKKEQFLDLGTYLDGMRDTEKRTKHQALAVFMFWLKSGLDQTTIATLFELESQQDVSRYNSQVRESLIKNFCTKYLGINKKKLIKNNINLYFNVF